MVKFVTKVEGFLPGVKFVGGKASIGNVDMVMGNDGKSIILYSTKMWNVQGKLDSSMSKVEVKQTMRRVHEAVDIYYKLVNDKRMVGVEIISTLYINREFINTVVRREGRPYKLAFRDIANVGTPKFSATRAVYDGKKAPRFKKVVEAAKAASKPKEGVRLDTKKKEFDTVRFHKYIDLVANFRPTYSEVLKLKTTKINTAALDLDDPLKILTGLVHRARLYNKLTYKSSNEEEAQRIINKVNKIKEERKESASAGSSLPSEFQVEEYKGERKWKTQQY